MFYRKNRAPEATGQTAIKPEHREASPLHLGKITSFDRFDNAGTDISPRYERENHMWGGGDEVYDRDVIPQKYRDEKGYDLRCSDKVRGDVRDEGFGGEGANTATREVYPTDENSANWTRAGDETCTRQELDDLPPMQNSGYIPDDEYTEIVSPPALENTSGGRDAYYQDRPYKDQPATKNISRRRELREPTGPFHNTPHSTRSNLAGLGVGAITTDHSDHSFHRRHASKYGGPTSRNEPASQQNPKISHSAVPISQRTFLGGKSSVEPSVSSNPSHARSWKNYDHQGMAYSRPEERPSDSPTITDGQSNTGPGSEVI